MLLGILAVNLDLPLCVFLLDASETNYSGFRGAIDQARHRWREIQSWMMGSFHGPVYEWKVRQWAVTDSALRKAVHRADEFRASLAAAARSCRHTPRRRRFEFIRNASLARTGHIHLSIFGREQPTRSRHQSDDNSPGSTRSPSVRECESMRDTDVPQTRRTRLAQNPSFAVHCPRTSGFRKFRSPQCEKAVLQIKI